MRKLVAGIAAAGAVFAVTTSASAQSFGEQGSMALSADRLFGFTSYNVKTEDDLPGAPEQETSGTSISLAWGMAPTGPLGIPVPGAIPRLSFDYFVIDSLSLGGSLGYYSASGEVDHGNVTTDLDDVSAFVLNPRVGYSIPLGDTAALWLRGGFTYMSVNIEPDAGGDSSGSILQLNAEAMFVIGIVENFGFEVGPALDLPLTGSYEYEDDGVNIDGDVSVLSFGGYGGLVGWF